MTFWAQLFFTKGWFIQNLIYKNLRNKDLALESKRINKIQEKHLRSLHLLHFSRLAKLRFSQLNKEVLVY